MKSVPILIFLIIIVTIGIVSIISFCDLDFKGGRFKNSYVKYVPNLNSDKKSFDLSNDTNIISNSNISNIEISDKNSYTKLDNTVDKNEIVKRDEIIKRDDKEEDAKIVLSKDNKEIPDKVSNEKSELNTKEIKDNKKEDVKKIDKIYININNDNPSLANYNYKAKSDYDFKDGVKDETNFHSLGDYVSREEYEYRVSLIKELKIKTIVIDSLKKGNNVQDEYFYIAYSKKMIPSKVLSEIVESNEFRKLIPEKYLLNNIRENGLDKGDSVVIKNKDLKDLLILWSLGKLSPVEKAVTVGAVK